MKRLLVVLLSLLFVADCFGRVSPDRIYIQFVDVCSINEHYSDQTGSCDIDTNGIPTSDEILVLEKVHQEGMDCYYRSDFNNMTESHRKRCQTGYGCAPCTDPDIATGYPFTCEPHPPQITTVEFTKYSSNPDAVLKAYNGAGNPFFIGKIQNFSCESIWSYETENTITFTTPCFTELTGNQWAWVCGHKGKVRIMSITYDFGGFAEITSDKVDMYALALFCWLWLQDVNS